MKDYTQNKISAADHCKVIITLFIFFAFSSCTNKSEEQQEKVETKNIIPPTIIRAGVPYVVNLDTCPKPQRIIIPVKDSQFFTMKTPYFERPLKMGPPAVNPAGFFVTMPKFSSEEGLQAHSVFSSFCDRAGNLWFGTHGGSVTRFDGKTAVTFTELECNDVRAIVEDENGNIWFGMGGCGLIKYDGRGLTNYTTEQGLVSNEIRGLCLDKKGNLWIGTDGYGVNCFDGKKFTSYTTSSGLANDKIMSIALDKKGNIWIGTDGGASCFNGKSFRTISVANGLIDNFIRSVICDKDGNIWFGTAGGISKYNGDSIRNFTISDGLINNNVRCLQEDTEGNIWIGTYGGGVSKYNKNGFQNFTKKNGLASDMVMTITPDLNGNLWIGAEGGGVTRYEGTAVLSFSTAEGLFNSYVTSIAEDNKANLWMGTLNGVYRYDGKTFTNFRWWQGFAQGRVNAIMQDKKENIWLCTTIGFSCYDGISFTNYNTFHGIQNNEVRCAIEDSAGNIWFGIENAGLVKFDGKSVSTFSTKQGLPSNNVRAIINDSAGNFWIGTFGKGLSRFDGKSFMNFDTAQGMAENLVLSMKKDSKGNLWVGSSNSGISILRKKTIDEIGNPGTVLPEKLFEKFTTQEGLANNVVYDIVEDKAGNIFIGTNFGLTVVKGGINPDRPIKNSDIEYYNQKSGYPVPDMNGQAMYYDSKGMIWGGTGGNLIRFDYSAVRKSVLPPLVTIQGIKIDNEKPGWFNLHFTNSTAEKFTNNYKLSAMGIEENIYYDLPRSKLFRDSMHKKFREIRFDSIARFYPVPLNLVLPYKHNNITIEFGAIEAAKPEFVQYQHKLEGYDRDWSPATVQSFATFGNIREGNYVFKVKARSPDGVWSEPIQYTFRVLPPRYRTWWAYTGYAICIIIILYGLYKNRIRKLEKKQILQLQTVVSTQEEERKRISRDLHDDIGTKLSALKLFLSSLKNNALKKRYQEVDQLASNSEQLVNDTIEDVREMLLNLSPGILEEFGYASAIEALINKINQANAIHFHLSTFGIKGKLRNEYELALYRITQELINNVLKHSEARNVSLQLGYRDEKIIIMIEDDGKGFDIRKHKDGYGLKNLEGRTKLLHGTMKIDSQIGKGTSVLVEVPYIFN